MLPIIPNDVYPVRKHLRIFTVVLRYYFIPLFIHFHLYCFIAIYTPGQTFLHSYFILLTFLVKKKFISLYVFFYIKNFFNTRVHSLFTTFSSFPQPLYSTRISYTACDSMKFIHSSFTKTINLPSTVFPSSLGKAFSISFLNYPTTSIAPLVGARKLVCYSPKCPHVR